MIIAIGSDHVGLPLKQSIASYLEESGIEYRDFGTYDTNRCHYPDIAAPVARAVANGVFSFGILCCGTGVGMSIAANKIPGVRSVVCSEPYSAKMSREHNNTNILCLGSRVVGTDLALLIVQHWLRAVYEGGRHQIRLDKIAHIETEARIADLKLGKR